MGGAAFGLDVIASLVAASIVETTKAGIRGRRKARQIVPPEEERRRRDSLRAHIETALRRSLREVAEWSQEWTALQCALRPGCDEHPGLVGQLIFGGDPDSDSVLVESKWRTWAGVDPERYDELVGRLIEAAKWAIAQDPDLAHYFGLFAPSRPEAPTVPSRVEPTTRFAVRHERNPRFVGREDDLAALHRVLRGGKPVAVVGLTGMGKTLVHVNWPSYTAWEAQTGSGAH